MKHLNTFFKGMAMGAADVVPGVSGGTVAFITGIYDTLLNSISRISPKLFKMWKEQGFNAAFTHINGPFLIALFSGILFSIFTLAKGITWALETHPIPVWSFFFGLILVSVWHILRQVQIEHFAQWLALPVGMFFAYTITVLNPLSMDPTNINFVIAGSIAISAMILPGISGSFILLLLGMYTPILAALKGFDITSLLLFASGCVIGLLTFSHLLSWLLRHFRAITFTFLVGLMIGTLPKIWPWKQTLTWRTNSSGEQVALVQENLTPQQFEALTGDASQILVAVLMMSIAIILVLALEKWADNE